MFHIEDLEIVEVKLIEPKVHTDGRGFFYELYKLSEFSNYNFPKFVQDNISFSNKKVLRGLHYQKEPHAQGKLLMVLSGKILDLIVDLRPKSKSFLQSLSIMIDSKKKQMIYIPPGFGHGFLALENETLVMYKTTEEYSSLHDSGIIWNDSSINFNWPVSNPLLSDKDQKLPTIKETFNV